MLRPSVGVDAVVELAEDVAQALGPQYQVREQIGRGGYAVVFRVYDKQLDRELAAKALIPEFAAVYEIAERFRQEARTVARLTHPNIVPIYFVGGEGHTPCYVMPLVDGETLAARIGREGQLAPQVALSLAQDIAGALDFAHATGVVHRDVKPENIMLELSSGRGLLMDFGIAKALTRESWLTASGVLVGTPYYMSPEQATGERDIDERSDVYSLGVVVYEMLAGEPPYGGLNAQVVLAQQVSGPVPDLGKRRDDLGEDATRVIARALAKDPADRYPKAGLFVAELQSAFGRAGMRRSGGAAIERQDADDIRLFRTLSTERAEHPLAALRTADDVATISEAARAAVQWLVEAAERSDVRGLVEALTLLTGRASDQQPALRHPVRQALQEVAEHEGVVGALAAGWRSGDGSTQTEVERVLAPLLPEAADVIVGLARREKSAEFILLADRVGALDDARAQALARDSSASVVQAFAKALQESMRPSQLIERWLSIVARHQNPEVRLLAAEVAASRGGALAERIGRMLIADPKPKVRLGAVWAMGESRRREAVPDLARVLSDAAVEEQVSAAEALGRLGLAEAVASLRRVFQRKRLLRQERGPVQQAAARALASMPGELGVPVLESLLGDRDAVVREIAEKAVGREGADRN